MRGGTSQGSDPMLNSKKKGGGNPVFRPDVTMLNSNTRCWPLKGPQKGLT